MNGFFAKDQGCPTLEKLLQKPGGTAGKVHLKSKLLLDGTFEHFPDGLYLGDLFLVLQHALKLFIRGSESQLGGTLLAFGQLHHDGNCFDAYLFEQIQRQAIALDTRGKVLKAFWAFSPAGPVSSRVDARPLVMRSKIVTSCPTDRAANPN